MPGVAITAKGGPATIPAQNMVPGAPAISPNGSAPRCEHIDGLAPVTPQSDTCPACGADVAAVLMVCLTCGWVACSDDSPGRHAKAHYQETNHPLARCLEPGSRRSWCYVHERLV